jgi:hypothetical protein
MACLFSPLHLHGYLGLPSWLSGPSESARPYDPNLPRLELEIATAGIALIHEELPYPEWAGDARASLEWAHEVCFLGFAYDPINMARLRLYEPLPNATLRGTALGFTKAELIPIEEFFRPQKVDLHRDYDALAFLRHTDVLHQSK